MLSDHEHNISVLSNLGLIERCNKPNTNTNTNTNEIFTFLMAFLAVQLIPNCNYFFPYNVAQLGNMGPIYETEDVLLYINVNCYMYIR